MVGCKILKQNMKYMKALITFIFVLGVLYSCQEDITAPDLSNEYPRVMSTWPAGGNDGTLGTFEMNVGDTLDFNFMYSPSSALSEWFLNGEKIGEGADYKLIASNFGSYHIKVLISNGTATTYREATVQIKDPSLNLDLLKTHYYISPNQELPLGIEYTSSETTSVAWYVDGAKIADTPNFIFNKSNYGEYKVKVEVKNAFSSLSKESVIVVRDPNIPQNMALFEDCKAIASGSTGDAENPDKARDGLLDETKWCDANSSVKWLMYEFSTPVQEITHFILNWENWDVNRNYKIEASLDGETWEEVVNITDNTQDPRENKVSIKGIRFVKFTLMESDDAIRLMEFEVWGIR